MTRENYCLKPVRHRHRHRHAEPKEPHKQERTKSRPSRSVSSAIAPTPTPTPYSDYTAVDVPNSLFWCLYIGKVGLMTTRLYRPTGTNVEMEQQKAITFLTATATKWNKQINHKITNINFGD
jgi:hypothetical protein